MISNLFSKTYEYISEGSSNVTNTLKTLIQSVPEVKFLQRNYSERIKNLDDAIEIQQSEVEYLENHNKQLSNKTLLKEINNLKGDLEKLRKEKEKLHQNLENLNGIEPALIAPENTFEPIAKFKKELKFMIIEDNLMEMLDLLLGKLNEAKESYNDVILIICKFRSLEKQKNLNLISLAEHNHIQSNMIYSILNLISNLKEEDLHLN